MATWADIRQELSRYRVVSEKDRRVGLVWEGAMPKVAVLVRAARVLDVDWLQVLVDLAPVREAALEALLRRCGAVMGAVVIEGDRCLLRERALLEPLVAGDVHGFIDLAVRQADTLRANVVARGDHPYADLF